MSAVPIARYLLEFDGRDDLRREPLAFRQGGTREQGDVVEEAFAKG